MKNFLNKMDFHYTYIIMAFGLVLTGHFINLIAFTSLIIIHEFGHVITATIYKYRIKKITIYPYGGITEFDTLVNTKIEKDLLIAISGIIFQSIYLIISIIHHLNPVSHLYDFFISSFWQREATTLELMQSL